MRPGYPDFTNITDYLAQPIRIEVRDHLATWRVWGRATTDAEAAQIESDARKTYLNVRRTA